MDQANLHTKLIIYNIFNQIKHIPSKALVACFIYIWRFFTGNRNLSHCRLAIVVNQTCSINISKHAPSNLAIKCFGRTVGTTFVVSIASFSTRKSLYIEELL